MIDERNLIARIQNRDQEAMVAFHARYVNLVFSIAFRILNESAAAEEATQDTFMKVWTSAAIYDEDRGVPAAWLSRIARNVAIDKLRSIHRQSGLDSSLDEVEAERSVLPTIPDWQDRERLPGLKLAVEALPRDQSDVIALSYFGGLSQTEIAEQLKIPLGTVKTRMRIALQKLKAAWMEHE
jgi:RNA polymerase sigma-70 factor (ECF subfamily)